MRSDNPPAIRLADYKVPDFLIDQVDLTFILHPTLTRVFSTLTMRRNPAGQAYAALRLDGEGLTLRAVTLNGETLPPEAYQVDDENLTLPQVPDAPFTLLIETEINPEANTRLMGLYRSSGIYCTQCEADGFRRITYFLDRPDVMARWRVRIEAEKAEAPLLLSNGNPVERGDIPDSTRHYAVWDDPHKKPCYLFALVAGDLDGVSDHHITSTGRKVELNVYVERGKAARAAYAMDSLKRSMAWDERRFGRDYDLDLFNIVAVSDFNMGAMENKGLNVFNDRYILADEATATDKDYHNIEAVVGHEYFHNWTGNRITCRDWFQLCLKEGLTVYRDQEFSSDERSRPVERIANVLTLRATQFVEDAGPLAHPVRPQAYKEINNFYTATVYNKGAEVIRMLALLIGERKFRDGMDLYFLRHDGEAATMEQFIACFAEVSGRDLTQFMRWYDQAGTPILSVDVIYDAKAKTARLDFAQVTHPTPGQMEKAPQVIPVQLGLLAEDGTILIADDLVVVDQAQVSKTYTNIKSRPIPSLLRGFSAPVRLDVLRKPGDLLVLAAHDTDSFNRWQALQDIEVDLLKRSVSAVRGGQYPLEDADLAATIHKLIETSEGDPAFAALAITLPREEDIAREIGAEVDPGAIGVACDHLRRMIGQAVKDVALWHYQRLSTPVPFSPDAASAGRRALRAALLGYIIAADSGQGAELALNQFRTADNMTDKAAALWALNDCSRPEREDALSEAEAAFADDALLLDRWFTLNACIPGKEGLKRTRALLKHPKFTLTNPNRVRSLVGAFAQANPRGFHDESGDGYALLAEIILMLDPVNPQIAARLATSFRTWRNLETKRRGRIEHTLKGILDQSPLSRDVMDILERLVA
jgi:aminopeptidase N